MPRKPGEQFIKKDNQAAQKARAKRYDYFERDKKTRDIYHSKEWTATRNAYISQHPICEDCLTRGIYTTATEVHHIKPLSDGGDPFDTHNLRSLCHACHMQTHGFKDNTRQRETVINVVYGAPCAGKTTFVNERFRYGDLFFDFDVILSAMSNTPVHSLSCQGHVNAVLAMRSALISHITDRICNVPCVWIIITDPSRIRRQLRLATYWYIDTPIEVCMSRATEDGRGTEVINAIKDYFMNIKKEPTDKRVGGGGGVYGHQKSTGLDSKTPPANICKIPRVLGKEGKFYG